MSGQKAKIQNIEKTRRNLDPDKCFAENLKRRKKSSEKTSEKKIRALYKNRWPKVRKKSFTCGTANILHEMKSESPEVLHERKSELPAETGDALHEVKSENRKYPHESKSELTWMETSFGPEAFPADRRASDQQF